MYRDIDISLQLYIKSTGEGVEGKRAVVMGRSKIVVSVCGWKWRGGWPW